MSFCAYLQERLHVQGISLHENQIDLLKRHYLLLVETNAQMNLTAITDEITAAEKHYVDSLLSTQLIDDYVTYEATKDLPLRIADLGSGGGFPGVPLAVAFPQYSFTLIESVGKKCRFLTDSVEELGLINTNVVNMRAEEAARLPEYRAGFDLVTMRAVSSLPVVLEYALPLLKMGGFCLAYKGKEAAAELAASQNALSVLGGELITCENFVLDRDCGQRTLILVKKVLPTPDKYPRRSGMAEKRPLK